MRVKELDRLIDSLPGLGFPGVDLIVTEKGKTVYRRMAGYSDADKTRPVSEKDLYWIFSCSKVVTCTAAMRLVEEGKLGLRDKVSDYLPTFANLTIADKNGTRPCPTDMRIVHLFTMTGGLDYNFNAPAVKEATLKPGSGTVSIASAMGVGPIGFEPGTRYRYSLCHDVLAAVVEVVSGVRFADYCRDLIFDPLGMTESGFHPDAGQLSRFADMYRYHNWDGTSEHVKCENVHSLHQGYDSGGAGVFSNAGDFIKLMTALAGRGTSPEGYRLLKPETVDMMRKNYLVPAALADFVSWRLYGYGWGLCGRVHMNPAFSMSLSPAGEFGWDGAAGAFCMADPDNQIAAYFSTHVLGASYLYREIHPRMRNLIYAPED
ncbi:MAG: beta-lactamase family protein [Clostridia bacterium]|nr:beta-lactamase family protein [Clostridia bacterium]